jgi:hypothetical protein
MMMDVQTEPHVHSQFWARVAALALAAVLIVGATVMFKGAKQAENDEFVYLSIANDLNQHRTFSDGSFSIDHAKVSPGRFFAPLYPLLLQAVSVVSPAARATINCYAEGPALPATACKANVKALLFVQVLLAAVSAVSVFAAAYFMSGSYLVANVSFAVALATGELQLYARTYLTENLAYPAFFVFFGLRGVGGEPARIWGAGARRHHTRNGHPGATELPLSLVLCDQRARARSGFAVVAHAGLAMNPLRALCCGECSSSGTMVDPERHTVR